jgi:hypothetical protein
MLDILFSRNMLFLTFFFFFFWEKLKITFKIWYLVLKFQVLNFFLKIVLIYYIKNKFKKIKNHFNIF